MVLVLLTDSATDIQFRTIELVGVPREGDTIIIGTIICKVIFSQAQWAARTHVACANVTIRPCEKQPKSYWWE